MRLERRREEDETSETPSMPIPAAPSAVALFKTAFCGQFFHAIGCKFLRVVSASNDSYFGGSLQR